MYTCSCRYGRATARHGNKCWLVGMYLGELFFKGNSDFVTLPLSKGQGGGGTMICCWLKSEMLRKSWEPLFNDIIETNNGTDT